MYIQIGDKNYPCTNYRPAKGVRAIFYGVEDLTLPVEDEIILFADDGFELATIVTGDFERQVYEDGTLTLTNEPEPIPEPEPTEPELDPITQLQLALAELAEAQAADQTANELALAELAEIILGG